LDVGFPLALGGLLGVADVMPELNGFAANVTLGHETFTPFKISQCAP